MNPLSADIRWSNSGNIENRAPRAKVTEELWKNAFAATEEEKANIGRIIQLKVKNKELVEKILALEAQFGCSAILEQISSYWRSKFNGD